MNLGNLKFNSCVAEITWPPIAKAPTSQVMAVLQHLDYSQWWTTQKIQQHQFQQLFKVFKHALETVPYYQSILQPIHHLSTVDELYTAWHSIPLLTRQALQSAQKNIYSNAALSAHGKIIPLSTSGSTGQPVTVLITQITQFFWQVFAMRDHLWHERNFQGKLAIIRPSSDVDKAPPHGKNFTHWGFTTYGVTETGPCWQLNTCTIDQEARWLLDCNPDYLLCFPSTLKALIHYMDRHHLSLTHLKEVRTVSELVEPDLRELTHEKFQVAIKDTYSAKEIGYIAIQCPKFEHYHIQCENVFLELLNENNLPCKVGEMGRVVITTLHNFASPLIRYDIGDYAIQGEQCDCGRGLPVLKSILGRQRNMLTLPDGRKTWPLFGRKNLSLNRLFSHCQFQLIQHSLSALELKLTSSAYSPQEEAQIKNQIQHILGSEFNISIQYVKEIHRHPSGKYEDFKSEMHS